jgi:hypothetical protein
MDLYPKSREELERENALLLAKVSELEQHARMLEATLRNKDAEVQMLRRRRPPHVLSPNDEDRFRRPLKR